MKRRLGSIAVGLVVAGVLAASASAVPPKLLSVGQQNRYPTATYSSPRSWLGDMWFSSSPARNPDGSFVAQGFLMDMGIYDENLTSGVWKGDKQLNPGTYWAILQVTPANDCYDDLLNLDPSCSAGYSNALQVVIPAPKPKYSVEPAFGLEGPHTLTLFLDASPVFDDITYRVCWTRVHPTKRRCLTHVLHGDPDQTDARDAVNVDGRTLGKFTKFTWSVEGKVVLSRRLRTNR